MMMNLLFRYIPLFEILFFSIGSEGTNIWTSESSVDNDAYDFQDVDDPECEVTALKAKLPPTVIVSSTSRSLDYQTNFPLSIIDAYSLVQGGDSPFYKQAASVGEPHFLYRTQQGGWIIASSAEKMHRNKGFITSKESSRSPVGLTYLVYRAGQWRHEKSLAIFAPEISGAFVLAASALEIDPTTGAMLGKSAEPLFKPLPDGSRAPGLGDRADDDSVRTVRETAEALAETRAAQQLAGHDEAEAPTAVAAAAGATKGLAARAATTSATTATTSATTATGEASGVSGSQGWSEPEKMSKEPLKESLTEPVAERSTALNLATTVGLLVLTLLLFTVCFNDPCVRNAPACAHLPSTPLPPSLPGSLNLSKPHDQPIPVAFRAFCGVLSESHR
jgi:tRNA(Leu) C34 or U34 (ribose-2'-O)-methylase TrmL